MVQPNNFSRVTHLEMAQLGFSPDLSDAKGHALSTNPLALAIVWLMISLPKIPSNTYTVGKDM